MFCNKCGNQLLPGAMFCGVCGAKQEIAEALNEATADLNAATAQVTETVAAVPEQAAAVATEATAATEQVAATAAAAVETIPEQAAAVVAETAESIPETPVIPEAPVYQQPVFEQPVAPAPAAPEAPVYQQPVFEQPVAPAPAAPEAPVYQQPAAPEAPVYQQPAAPVYQQPAAPEQPMYQQPVYQQPIAPVYPQQAAPMYQQPYQAPGYPQPAAPAKKKSKAPVIIICIFLILAILVGSGIAYLTFFDKNGEKKLFGINLNIFDFSQLSAKEKKAFQELVEPIDEAFAGLSARKFKKNLADYAVDYACRMFGSDDVEDMLEKNYDKYLKKACGGDAEVTSEKAYLMYEIKDTDGLRGKIKKEMGATVEIKKAYLVENICEYTGSEGKQLMSDLYIFYNDGDEWNILLIGENSLKAFGLE
ncbi:MAG: zinc-ribbon domain-containing protein [Lachnospiraceae bacterium]|nr:zinc-ribbon domain-containing protein [Lachnospiraceae bacterium]